MSVPEEVESVAIPMTFSASMDNAETRTSFIKDENVYHHLWSADDEISVFAFGSLSNDQYTITSCEGGTAVFGGTSIPAQGQNTYAVYPYSKDNTCSSSGKLTFSYPDVQHYSADSFGEEANVMLSCSQSSNLSFLNACSYLKLSVTSNGESITRITIKGSSGEKLAGPAQADLSDGVSISMLEGASNAVVLDCGQGVITGEAPTDFYIAVPPVDFSSGFEVTFEDNRGGSMTVSTSSSISLNRNMVRPVSVRYKSSLRSTSFDESAIVASFGVVSDVHVNTGVSSTSNKWRSCLQQLKSRSSADADGLDAMLIAGDLIDNPNNSYLSAFKTIYESELDPTKVPMIYTIGNHDVPNYRWSYSMVEDAVYLSDGLGSNYFLFDQDQNARTTLECRHCVVDGYNIICITPNGTQPIVYDSKAVKWLDEKLAAITAAEPDKYVIILSHAMIANTIYGSLLGEADGEWYSSYGHYWATSALTSVLSKYPQAVVFGGHLHFPLNDPRSAWQGDFSVFGCASVRYMALENGQYQFMAGVTTMQDKDEFSQGNLLQFDKNGNMRLTRMDFYHSAVIEQPLEYEYPQTNKNHLHTSSHAEMMNSNQAPVMTSVEVSAVPVGSENTYSVKWAAAQDDMFAHHYVLTLSQNGTKVSSWKILADFYRHPLIKDMKPEYIFSIGSLPAGDYTLTVIAVDSWGLASNAVSCDFKAESSAPSTGTSLFVDVDFSAGAVSDACGHAVVTNVASAPITKLAVSHAGKSGSMYGVTLNGSSYISGRITSLSTTDLVTKFAQNGFSVEAFYVDYSPGSTVHGIFCATEMGGWGLAARATAVPYFIVGDKSYNTYRYIDAASAASKTELTHVVGVYDYAARTIRIYVNGKLSGTNTFTGPYYPGAGDTFNRFIIGGDTKNGATAGDFPPTNMVVVDAKMYSGSLSASEVAAAYDNAVKSITQ